MLGPTEPLGDVGPTTQNPCHSQGCVGPSCADPRYLNAPWVLPRKTHRACYESLKIEVPLVRTMDNWSDFFTRAFEAKKFHAMRRVIMNDPERA